MASMSINNHQSSLFHSNKINDIFKSNHIFSLNHPILNQLKCKHLKKNSINALLKPFLKPLLSSPDEFTPMKKVDGPMLFGGDWAQMVAPSGRADFRVWSGRRPGSKSKETRLIVTLECVCLKNRYTTERHKDFAMRKADKEKQIAKQIKRIPSISEQVNNDKSQSEAEVEKEKRRLKRQEEQQQVNASPSLLQLYKFCPKCRKHTLHKEVKVHKR